MPDEPAPIAPPLPVAVVKPAPPRRGFTRLLPWLIPAAALMLVVVLIAQSMAARGPRMTLGFAHGHGLRPGDPVVHRGVQVGRIRSIGFGASSEVRIRVELTRDAGFLKDSGRFWIVRPELSLSGVSGLETIIGPRYIAAETGRFADGRDQGSALEAPPAVDGPGLALTIRAARAGSLSAGSPVSYRELAVGSVTRVVLAEDARSVDISVLIAPEHAHLVRTNTRFWNASGIGLDLGLIGGLKLKAESLRTILTGGLAFATPERPGPGEAVTGGAVFDLSEYDDDYLKWSPELSR